MQKVFEVPAFKVTPDHITIYNVLVGCLPSDKKNEGYKNITKNSNKYWELSFNARKRLKEKLSLFIYTSKNKNIKGKIFLKDYNKMTIEKSPSNDYIKNVNYKMVMITLTLPAKQKHTDNEIKSKLLNQFLTEMRTKKHFTDYIWKAEKQDNGNIHFHILTNKYISWELIREVWNRIVNKKGFKYVADYQKKQQKFFQNGFKSYPTDNRPYAVQYNAYTKNKKCNWTNPNSTDVVAIKNSKYLLNYLIKYIGKGVTNTIRKQRLVLLYDRQKMFQNLDHEKLHKSIISQIYGNPNFISYEMEINIEEIFDNIIKKTDKLLCIINEQIDYLKKKGVQGLIWSSSATISKLKSLSVLDVQDFIPSIIELNVKSQSKSVLEIAKLKFETYYYDIKQFPKLQKEFDNHLINL